MAYNKKQMDYNKFNHSYIKICLLKLVTGKILYGFKGKLYSKGGGVFVIKVIIKFNTLYRF